MEVKLLLLMYIVLSTAGLARSLDCQIQNIKISATNISATITWDVSADCARLEIYRYEVQWEHLKYEACDKKNVNDQTNIGSMEVAFPSRIAKTEDNLHPYSTYEVFIKVTTGTFDRINSSASFRTEAGVPGRNEDFQGSVDRAEQALRFHWADPAQCQFVNGRLDKYVVELHGLDPWVASVIDLPYNDTILEDYYAQNLSPFTSYLLRVYARNTAGLVSREPLDIKVGSTVPGQD